MFHSLRITPKHDGSSPNTPGKFHWTVQECVAPGDSKTVIGGGEETVEAAAEAGITALKRAIAAMMAEGPARHEWDCDCGTQLAIEARRSKKSPYAWDSPREIQCQCGRSYGVKLTFTSGRAAPFIDTISR